MRFLLLGSVATDTGAGPMPVPGRHRTALLAALVLARREVLTEETLTDLLWGLRAPREPHAALKAQIGRLRQYLDTVEPLGAGRRRLVTQQSGYRLDVAEEETDFGVFLQEVRAAENEAPRSAPDAMRRLDRAVRLWRGPLALPGDNRALGLDLAGRLEEAHTSALSLLATLRIAAGDPGGALPDLQAASALYPYDERFPALQMEALATMGRTAEAVDLYSRTTRLLREELDVAPGPLLQRRLRAVLSVDPARRPHLTPPTGPHSRRPAPDRPARPSAPMPVGDCLVDEESAAFPDAKDAWRSLLRLLDRDSFVGLRPTSVGGTLLGEAVDDALHGLHPVAGLGTIGRRPVAVHARTAPVTPGTVADHTRAQRRLTHIAESGHMPLITLAASDGHPEPAAGARRPAAFTPRFRAAVPAITVLLDARAGPVPTVHLADDLLLRAVDIPSARHLLRVVLAYFPEDTGAWPPRGAAQDGPATATGQVAEPSTAALATMLDPGSWTPVATASHQELGLARLGGHPIGVLRWSFDGPDLTADALRLVQLCDGFGLAVLLVIQGDGPAAVGAGLADKPVALRLHSVLTGSLVPRLTVVSEGLAVRTAAFEACSDVMLWCDRQRAAADGRSGADPVLRLRPQLVTSLLALLRADAR
ncbi:bacterial transcriptional activator domain-containing protein [Streptomyces sp. NPDC047130]|uniref:bacterial transcriptional activator domain-containing protein n=1 Tax=Streptomyces sp. NPDC047130 TaxID=3155261 RepID=UPI0033FF1131